jgi:hypothetical protein
MNNAGSREVLEDRYEAKAELEMNFVIRFCVVDGRVELKMLDKLKNV